MTQRFHMSTVGSELPVGAEVVWNGTIDRRYLDPWRRPPAPDQLEHEPRPGWREYGYGEERARVRAYVADLTRDGLTFTAVEIATRMDVGLLPTQQALTQMVRTGHCRIVAWEPGRGAGVAARYTVQPAGSKPVPSPPRVLPAAVRLR